MVVPEGTPAEFREERPVIKRPMLEDRVNPGLHITRCCIDLV